MFMIVKYGDGKEHFFNTNCQTKVLLECIKEKCDPLNEGLVDIADENGELMFLPERRNHYGNEFLKPRGVYILIRRARCSQNYPIYTPLLEDKDVVNEEFLNQLNLMRERAIRKDEDQRLLESERTSNGKGRPTGGRKVQNRDTNFKRTQSLLGGGSKKLSKGRPSR